MRNILQQNMLEECDKNYKIDISRSIVFVSASGILETVKIETHK